MILEVVEFHVRPGQQAAFEQAMTRALHTITAGVSGVKGYTLIRCMESPERYLLQVTWEKLEDHMVTYRQSPDRDAWRAIVSPFYAQPPVMEHFSPVVRS